MQTLEEVHLAGRGHVGKAVVAGLLERGETFIDEKTGEIKKTASKVKAVVVPDTKRSSLHPVIRENVEEGSELMTDAGAGYNGLESDYVRGVVDHAVRYVEGRVSTNGLENFWTLTKRMIKGTYVSVESEHLEAYLGEEVFRFNERKDDDAGRFLTTLRGTEGKRLDYQTLIGNPQGIDSPDPLRGGPRAD